MKECRKMGKMFAVMIIGMIAIFIVSFIMMSSIRSLFGKNDPDEERKMFIALIAIIIILTCIVYSLN